MAGGDIQPVTKVRQAQAPPCGMAEVISRTWALMRAKNGLPAMGSSGHRGAEIEALQPLDTDGLQCLSLGLGLHPLGHRLQPQIP